MRPDQNQDTDPNPPREDQTLRTAAAMNQSRMDAKSAIVHRLICLRQEISGLEALLNVLPANLPAVSQAADSALWNLLMRRG